MTRDPLQAEHSSAGDVVMELSHVNKTFVDKKSKSRTSALKEVSFVARKGKITGLVGPDAAGKTTLMRMVAGLMVPDSGTITVLEKDAGQQSLEVQSEVGYMPQRFGLYEDLSTQENLDLYADLQGVPRRNRSERYEELMHMTNLGPFVGRLAGRLSGGMKQKLGLACALVRFPRLLILDEPTVGVDPLSRRELWSIIYRLVRKSEMSVVLSTAYLDETERCDHVILIHEGTVLSQGSPDDFKARTKGRAFVVNASGLNKRSLQERLARQEDILDATIQGGNVRLVTKTGSPPQLQGLPPNLSGLAVEPVPARFEDSFVSILREQESISESTGNSGFDMHQSRRPSQSSKMVIEVKDLTRRFGNFYAVNGITFDVGQGEVFGLLGANGAGKSTTFRMLCGLLPISSGTVRVAGVDLRQAPAKARLRIGYMSQKFSLYGDLSVRQNLKFFSSAYGLTGKHRRKRIEWALDKFGLSTYAEVNSIGLPLGYKQRLAMACSLMHSPEILFLDEPTSGVDPLARREFWSQINALAEQGVTVMVTTHFMEEAEYCDRLAIMAAGKILTLGTPAEIRKIGRSDQIPEPTIEDAFIRLIEQDGADRKTT
ncbi:MAG: ATP-binding cassette domain-containing protein [Sedimentisphaerales bacterium]